MGFSRLLWAVALSLGIGVVSLFVIPTAMATESCQDSTVLTITHPTTLDALHLTGQTLQVAAPLRINGPLTGCAATVALLPGGSLYATTIDVTATTILVDGGHVTTTGHLRLTAQTLALHDSATMAMQVQSGGDVVLTGSLLLDLRSVHHAESVLQATGNMILRSAHPVRGDAHYVAGGSVQVETLTGQPSAVYSPDDPIVLAQGDVSFGSYTGASLHVVAGGSVHLGAVQITGSDSAANTINPSNTTLFNGSTPIAALVPVTLSNGTTLNINGNTRPTLDVRAGVDWSSFGGLGSNQTIGTATPTFGASATSAAITITSIANHQPDSQVILTNNYHPNNILSGNITVGTIYTYASASNINAGSVTIDGRDDIKTGHIDTKARASSGTVGNGGNVTILGDNLEFANIDTVSDNMQNSNQTGNGGTVVIKGLVVKAGSIATFSASGYGVSGSAGSITIDAQSYPITGTTLDASIFSARGGGRGGNITFSANGPVHFYRLRSHTRILNGIGGGGIVGDAGDIKLLIGNAGALDGADSLTVADHLTADSGVSPVSVGSTGSSGDIWIEVEDGSISLLMAHTPSFARGGSHTAGPGGAIVLRAPRGSISVQNQVAATSTTTASSGGSSNGGPITLEALNNISLGSGFAVDAMSGASSGASGSGGSITMTAGGSINASGVLFNANSSSTTGSSGPAGSITVNAGGAVTLGTVTANSLRTDGAGNAAGTIRIISPQTVMASSLEAQSTGTSLGTGGTVDLDVGFLRLTDSGPAASISTAGLANTGVITITHDGNGATPFVVGDSSTNGTAKALVSSSASIVPTRSFLYSHTEAPNIHIISIAPPLEVDAGGTQTVYEGLPVVFHGTVSDTPAAVAWDFGDGTGATESLMPGHTYADNGIYTVTLTVTSTAGLVSADTVVITVLNVAPIVNAGPDQLPMPRYGGSLVSFHGSYSDLGSADTHTVQWNFGDGATATGTLTPTHSYSIPGTYTVTLTVTDDDGGVTTDTLDVVLRDGSFLFLPYFSNHGDL